MNEQIEQILVKLQEIAPTVLEQAERASIVNGCGMLGLGLAALLGVGHFSKWALAEKDDEIKLAGLMSLVLGMPFVFILITSGINRILNPAYFAFKYLIGG